MFSRSSSYNPYQHHRDHFVQQMDLGVARAQAAVAYAQQLRRAYHPGLLNDDFSLEETYIVDGPWEQAHVGTLRCEALHQRQLEALMQELADLRERQERTQAQAREQCRQIWEQVARSRSSYPAATPPPPPPPPPSRSPTPSPPTEPAPSPNPAASQPEPTPSSPERREEAATTIQTAYRIHRAFRTVTNLERQFEALVFICPPNIDYQTPKGVVTIAVPEFYALLSGFSRSPLSTVPKLAFTPTNRSIHSYTEELNRLLVKLDAVESWGDMSVRKSRRRVVKCVESEANGLELYWKRAWVVHAERSSTGVVALEDLVTETKETGGEVVDGVASAEVVVGHTKLEEDVRVEDGLKDPFDEGGEDSEEGFVML